MTKDELIKLISEKLKVSDTEEQLAFRIFIDSIADELEKNEAVRLKEIGVFQLKQESVQKPESASGLPQFDRKYSLIYSPMTEEFASESKTLFLKIDLPNLKISSDFDDEIFSPGINKPMVPFTENLGGKLDNETSYLLLRKGIEEKVKDLLAKAEKLENFDLWEDYLSNKKSEAAVLEEDEPVTEGTSVPEDELINEDPLQELTEDSNADNEPPAEKNEEEKSKPDAPASVEEEDLSLVDFEDEEQSEDHIEMLNQMLSEEEDENDLKSSEATDSEAEEETEKEDELDELINTDELLSELNEPEAGDQNSDETEFGEESGGEEQEPVETISDDLLDVDFDEPEEDVQEEKSEENTEDEEPESLDESPVEESKEEPVDDFDEEELGSVPSVSKRKFSFGRTFWIILAAFILVNIGAGYFIFFTGTNVPGDHSESVAEKDSVHNTNAAGDPVNDIEEDGEELNKSEYKLSLGSKNKTEKDSVEPDIDASELKMELPKEDGTGRDRLEISAEEADSLTRNLQAIYQDITNEERLPNSNVFYDGTKYNTQISSWKNRAKAESEVKRLRSKGYNAFITKVYLEKFGGTWYRVKVGYYNSEAEAKSAEINIK